MARVLLKGDIVSHTPYFYARVDSEHLVLGENGDIQLVVDTGFTGAVALPQELIERMGLEMVAETAFTLANGEKVTLPVYLGRARIPGGNEVETWFVPGDYLLGVEFLSGIGETLVLEFSANTVSLLSPEKA